MDLLLILTYTAICVVIFTVFKLPLNEWTVPTAALGGVIIIGALILLMNYNHPYSNMAREFFVTTPIVPAVGGIVTGVEVDPNQLVEKGTVLFRVDPKPYEAIVRQKQALLPGSHEGVRELEQAVTPFQGNRGQRPLSVAPLAEMLRLNGYSTAAFGKYHETAPWEVSVSGPFDRWPTGSGFDKFYGFIGGETNQFAPVLHDGTAPVHLPDDPDYHFTTDMTNQAITWARSQQSLTPDKPFFIYFATGATHAPHHVPADWVGRYKGKFDDGWDAYREQTLARQIELRVVPPGTEMAPKPDDIVDWETLSEDEQRLYARQMEIFAAFAEHTDHEVGRLVDAIKAMGEMDNTLFIYIFGDNGSSAEGGLAGTFNETIVLNALPDPVEDQLQYLDEWGGPTSYPHFQAGWAVATNTPFQWTKQVASHYGGTRNPMVVHWPDGITAKGEIRAQWHHVTDIAPTVMEAAGLPFPNSVNGTIQKPFEGVSLIYSFDDPDAAD